MAREHPFEIKGTWGKVIVLAIVAFGIVYASLGRTLEPEAEEAIRKHLQHGGYLRHALKQFDAAGGLGAGNADDLARDLAETARAEVEIVSVKAKGRGRTPVVRVEFAVDGRPPEGEDAVQYFRMRSSSFTGWRVDKRTSAVAYYLPFFVE